MIGLHISLNDSHLILNELQLHLHDPQRALRDIVFVLRRLINCKSGAGNHQSDSYFTNKWRVPKTYILIKKAGFWNCPDNIFYIPKENRFFDDI
jgi:hypothetical protein